MIKDSNIRLHIRRIFNGSIICLLEAAVEGEFDNVGDHLSFLYCCCFHYEVQIYSVLLQTIEADAADQLSPYNIEEFKLQSSIQYLSH